MGGCRHFLVEAGTHVVSKGVELRSGWVIVDRFMEAGTHVVSKGEELRSGWVIADTA